MAEDGKGDTPEVALDLDEQITDLEAAMRAAVAAVEAGSRRRRPVWHRARKWSGCDGKSPT